MTAAGVAVFVSPNERSAAPRLHVDAEMALVPHAEGDGVLRTEENAADAGYFFHIGWFVW